MSQAFRSWGRSTGCRSRLPAENIFRVPSRPWWKIESQRHRASTERFLVERISKLWTFRKGSIDNEQ